MALFGPVSVEAFRAVAPELARRGPRPAEPALPGVREGPAEAAAGTTVPPAVPEPLRGSGISHTERLASFTAAYLLSLQETGADLGGVDEPGFENLGFDELGFRTLGFDDTGFTQDASLRQEYDRLLRTIGNAQTAVADTTDVTA